MNRFILPASIAAAVHGLVFGIPGGSAPRITPAEKPDTFAESFRPVLPLVPKPVEVTDEVFEAPARGGAAVEKPTLEETPSVLGRKDFAIPVTPIPVTTNLGPIRVIPAAPYGPGGDGIGGTGPAVVSARYLDHTPTTRVMIAPTYPTSARHEGIEGEVNVEFTVDEAGNVHGARVVSSTDPVFEAAALTAVGKWRFAPGTRSGIPVRFRMVLPVVFRMDR